jgi:hypothetical protein
MLTPTPPEEAWGFEQLFTFYDDQFQEFYIMGRLVNNTGSDQRVITLWPVVLDEGGDPVTSKDDVDAIGSSYKELREGISLSPGSGLSFSFLVYLPAGVVVDDNYDWVVEAEPAPPTRDDIGVTHDYDDSDWPFLYYVAGTYEIPAPELSEYVAIVVTLYDEADRVIGMGWDYETNVAYLTVGQHEYAVEVELWEIVDYLQLEVASYSLQLFAY